MYKNEMFPFQFWSDYFFRAPQDAIVKTLVRNRVDTYVYVQNTTVEALKLPWWRQITHNLEHYFLSGAPFMDPVFFSEEQQVSFLKFLFYFPHVCHSQDLKFKVWAHYVHYLNCWYWSKSFCILWVRNSERLNTNSTDHPHLYNIFYYKTHL